MQKRETRKNKTFFGLNWLLLIAFIFSIFLGTYLSRLLPNGLHAFLKALTGLDFPWNYNHGIAVLVISLIFYKLSRIKKELSILGSNKLAGSLFPIVFIVAYALYGIDNHYGINPHLWAALFCVFTLAYDIMEEYAWRGFLIESLGKMKLFIKGIISGILWALWHLLIFDDFNQFGGFWAFIAFCIITSLIFSYAAVHTKSIIVPATLHAVLIRTNYVTLACFLIYFIWLLVWHKPWMQPKIRKVPTSHPSNISESD